MCYAPCLEKCCSLAQWIRKVIITCGPTPDAFDSFVATVISRTGHCPHHTTQMNSPRKSKKWTDFRRTYTCADGVAMTIKTNMCRAEKTRGDQWPEIPTSDCTPTIPLNGIACLTRPKDESAPGVAIVSGCVTDRTITQLIRSPDKGGCFLPPPTIETVCRGAFRDAQFRVLRLDYNV